jgi:predicted acylesterase/phospholipase RssA
MTVHDPNSGSESDRRDPARDGVELRIALAMRGGVSLAVWIGGAMSEIDLARRGMLAAERGDDSVLPDEPEARARAVEYRKLLWAKGYTSLRVDVLAGASAGGLNAVIYGYAQAVGIPLEFLARVWEEEGELWKLFHPSWRGSKPYRTEALLRGDEVFYNVLVNALERQAPRQNEALRSEFLTVDLAATLQDGPPLRSRSTGEDVRPPTAHFRFRHTPAVFGPLNDVEKDLTQPSSDLSRRRLAYAARATSSFPGAFEPAVIRAYPTPASTGAQVQPPQPAEMHDVFSEVVPNPDSIDAERVFDVIDGGVFDNIPIGRAVQAIADAPSGKLAHRILIYLDPDPPTERRAPEPRQAFSKGRRTMRSTLLRTTLRTFTYKLTVETADDDMAELRKLRAEHEETNARRYRFLASLPHPAEDLGAPSYAMTRSQVDANRILGLLLHPGVGFLRSLAPQPALTNGFTETEALAFARQLRSAVANYLGGVAYAPEQDPWTLVYAASMLIAQAKRIQASRAEDPDIPSPVDDRDLVALKWELNRLLSSALLFAQLRDRRAVIGVLSGVEDTAGQVMTTLFAPGVEVANLDTEQAPLPTWDQLTLIASHPDADDFGSYSKSLWAYAATVFNTFWPSRVTSGDRTVDEVRRAAEHYLVATGPLISTGVPRFFTMTGDESVVSRAAVQGVWLPGVSRAVDAWASTDDTIDNLRLTGLDTDALTDRGVNASTKLAGNQLANFAGFLHPRWRRHDWAWGRTDGAAALKRIFEAIDDHEPDQPKPPLSLVGLPGAILDNRKPRLGDLTSDERFALISRASLGAQRALWPLTPGRDLPPKASLPQGVTLRRVSKVPGALALVVLRPLLMVLPLLVRPGLLAVTVGFSLMSHHVHTTDHVVNRVVGLIAMGIPTLLAGTGVPWILSRRQRLAQAESALAREADFERVRQAIAGERTALAGRSVALVGLGLVSLVLMVWLAVTHLPWDGDLWGPMTPDMVALGLGVSAAVLALRRSSVERRLTGDVARPRRKLLVALGTLLLVGAAAAAHFLDAWRDDAWWWARSAVAVACAIGVWCIHHYWCGMVWPTIVALLSGVVAFAVQSHVVVDFATVGSLPGPAAAVLIPAVAGAGVFAIALAIKVVIDLAPEDTDKNKSVIRNLVLGAGVVVLSVSAGIATMAVYAVWPFLSAVPLALSLAAAVASATTLVLPFRSRLQKEPNA